MKIQSISDIITNSSTEVFVVRSHQQEVSDMLHNIYEAIGRDIDRDMFFRSISKTGTDHDSGYNIKVHRGDMLIESVSDNTIPESISGFIEFLPGLIPDMKYCDVQKYGVSSKW